MERIQFLFQFPFVIHGIYKTVLPFKIAVRVFTDMGKLFHCLLICLQVLQCFFPAKGIHKLMVNQSVLHRNFCRCMSACPAAEPVLFHQHTVDSRLL